MAVQNPPLGRQCPSKSHSFTLSRALLAFASSIFSFSAVASSAALPEQNISRLQARQSPTTVCKRWSGQSALVNGTLYYYGGRTMSDYQQVDNTWNNDFITLDLTKSWNNANPPLTGLPQPDGPPAVALGYLWNSLDSLYLYGGQYSDTPNVAPLPYTLWAYNIASKSWDSHGQPTTSSGEFAPEDGTPVQNAAEGAGVSVPSIGRGYYFGGHLDEHTTAGWSNQIPRVYLKSLLEFTYPGYPNVDVNALSGGQTAGSDGVFRNVTDSGTQSGDGFPERADGVLVYIPGFSKEGILIGLAGGTAATLTQMNIIDVYDIANSQWYKQSTSGPIPDIRVNPCAVVAAAADGSSYNIYMYGGQTLVFNNTAAEVEKSDVWILSVPSFTWIQVEAKGQVPYGRSGHTCNVWDAQMVVVGGYVGPDLSCESPGYYVFDLSTLEWTNQFTSRSSVDGNPLSQQLAQKGQSSGMQGSYGYVVPDSVQAAIGGDGSGGATVTAPVAGATAGPLATGSPPHYTVNSGTDPSDSSGSGGSTGSGNSGPNVGAIVAGVIAGVFFLLICYLLVCVVLYRKRLSQYRSHLDTAHDLAQPSSNDNDRASVEKGAFAWSGGSSPKRKARSKTPLARGRSPEARNAEGLVGTNNQANKSQDDLLIGMEPTFVGIMLHPRRSLRVVNK